MNRHLIIRFLAALVWLAMAVFEYFNDQLALGIIYLAFGITFLIQTIRLFRKKDTGC